MFLSYHVFQDGRVRRVRAFLQTVRTPRGRRIVEDSKCLRSNFLSRWK